MPFLSTFDVEILSRLGSAVLVGALLGYERERSGRSAGLRTNLLVCVGAEVIIKEKQNVRGLTTAATLWVGAGIGMACGAGLYLLAFSGALISLLTLAILKNLSSHLAIDHYYLGTVVCDPPLGAATTALEAFFSERQISVLKVGFAQDRSVGTTTIDYHIRCKRHSCDLLELAQKITALDFVQQTKVR
ncbi:MAG: MgtC/SapB family protein [Desulfuromonadales bacterium]|nr:MgtC/SapB family protein [Desulfuromonadales bacterium]MDT8422765.1 MgtC/SapB family protein [Desulfuromonadales bacterium]